jgi:hypothetical protein
MRTPAGTECLFYYQDFHRGRARQECRLIDRTPGGGIYSPDLCTNCRVPRIVNANACPNMILEARVATGFLGFRKRVKITATCTRSLEPVAEPEIGCGLCHQAFPPIIDPEAQT